MSMNRYKSNEEVAKNEILISGLLPGMNLQLFAEEKTEKATPKKKKDARERGHVLNSADFSSAFVLIIAFGCLKLIGPYSINSIIDAVKKFLSADGMIINEILSIKDANKLFAGSALVYIKAMWPLFITVMLAGMAINYAQVGFLFTSKTIGFKMSRLNPLEGFKRMLSFKGLFQLFKAILKLIVIGWIAYKEIIKQLGGFPALIGFEINASASIIASCILNMGFKTGIALLIMGILDYLYQWWEYDRDLRMTKQEVKEEYKQMEGDPQIKGKIREKQRQVSARRMMQAVPDATVVVTNPTHYAVALLYKEEQNKAPVVVAKGQGYVALKIRETAKKNGVEIVENKAVAQALYKTVEIGQEIPIELYQAVAEILAYVMLKARG